MNTQALVAAALAISLGLSASPTALADPPKHARGHGASKHHKDHWHSAPERHWHGERHHVTVYQRPRGYEHREWHRGDRVPASYRSSRYVITDYRVYNLYAPPRGHYWVRVDNDVLLTAIGTGVVAAVVYGLFY
jgi:Ni/Co efflux regulator RcnB